MDTNFSRTSNTRKEDNNLPQRQNLSDVTSNIKREDNNLAQWQYPSNGFEDDYLQNIISNFFLENYSLQTPITDSSIGTGNFAVQDALTFAQEPIQDASTNPQEQAPPSFVSQPTWNANYGSIQIPEVPPLFHAATYSHGMYPTTASLPSPIPAYGGGFSQHHENGVSTSVPEYSQHVNRGVPNSITTSTDGSKGCRCGHKTQCLKRYCECFAANQYCGNSCSCRGCSNNSANSDKVQDHKKKIKSHDESAFTPKIIISTSSNDNMENDSFRASSSAKHRKGCTCLKSKCEKKYCECYKGGVGCSSMCRCQDCQNFFGKRGGQENAGLGGNPYLPSSNTTV